MATDDPGRAAGGVLGEYAQSPRSTADLVRDIISNAQEMVRSEVRLAKAELGEEIAKTVAAAKLLAIAAVTGLFSLGFVLVTVALLLARFMPMWASTLLIGVVLGIVAAVFLSKGRPQLKLPTPDKTIENVKENVQWVKHQTRS